MNKMYGFMCNKKVLLRERKRHTARRVVSTPSVVLPGYPPGGVPGQVPPGGYPVRYPPPPRGVPGPPGGVPGQVPPRCPMAFWEMLQSIMGYGYPPPRCGQTNKVKLLPSRRTTYASGNYQTSAAKSMFSFHFSCPDSCLKDVRYVWYQLVQLLSP